MTGGEWGPHSLKESALQAFCWKGTPVESCMLFTCNFHVVLHAGTPAAPPIGSHTQRQPSCAEAPSLYSSPTRLPWVAVPSTKCPTSVKDNGHTLALSLHTSRSPCSLFFLVSLAPHSKFINRLPIRCPHCVPWGPERCCQLDSPCSHRAVVRFTLCP